MAGIYVYYTASISGSQATSDSLTDTHGGFLRYCAKGNYVYVYMHKPDSTYLILNINFSPNCTSYSYDKSLSICHNYNNYAL